MKLLLTDAQKALDQTAALLAIPSEWLKALIDFESSWNPAARNASTGARGLIQFLPKTAQALGYLNADDLVLKFPTAAAQLKTPVYAYLKQFKPYPTKQSLYMAVFYPAARSWPTTAFFPDTVRKANPNIDTVQNYIDHVEKKKIIKTAGTGAAALAIVAGICFMTYKQFTKGKGKSWPRKTGI